MTDPKPDAEVVKSDAKGQTTGTTNADPNPCGRHSANPTVVSKDGDASPGRATRDRAKLDRA